MRSISIMEDAQLKTNGVSSEEVKKWLGEIPRYLGPIDDGYERIPLDRPDQFVRLYPNMTIVPDEIDIYRYLMEQNCTALFNFGSMGNAYAGTPVRKKPRSFFQRIRRRPGF